MEQGKIKTLIILTPGFPENENDSTCVPPQQIFVKALKEVSPQLNIIVLTFQYPFFSKEYEWNGIKVISFGNPRNSRVLRFFSGLRVWMELRKLNKEYQIVGLLSFWLDKCALIGNNFAKRHKLTHYCWLLGQDAKAGNKYFDKIKPSGGSLIALSDFIVREFGKNYGVKPAYIIPVGIDTSLFNKIEFERDIDILGAGSLIPLKQYAVFLEVIYELKDLFPAIKAVICGNGEEMGRLVEMVNNLDLKDNITFTGRLPHTEVLKLMQRSKVFVHPSAYEGFGAVCLEALYAGAKVVSFVQPMDMVIQNWHIAADKPEMLQLIQAVLFNPDKSHQPVLPYTIQDNARAALKLFDL